MYLIKKYSKMWFLPLLLLIIIAGCDNDDGIITPTDTQYNVTLASNPVAGVVSGKLCFFTDRVVTFH
jgi:hypothetical protein